MGFLIGLVMGILAGYDVAGTGQLAVQTGAVMVIMPKMVALLMEGLTPISEAANEFVKNVSLEENFISEWICALSRRSSSCSFFFLITRADYDPISRYSTRQYNFALW